MAQETVKIINVKRTISKDKKFEAVIFKTLWEKRKEKLKKDGWLLDSDIKEIKVEKIEDGAGEKTVTIEAEEVEEKTVEVIKGAKSYSEMSVDELKAECVNRNIIFHNLSKEVKLISLLEEDDNK